MGGFKHAVENYDDTKDIEAIKFSIDN